MRGQTRQSLLDAAELLFARHGIGNTTVRMVVSEVDANVAAISFHFGSFEALKKEVLLRRLEPLMRERVEALASLKSRSRKSPAAIDVLRAWMDPVLAMLFSQVAGERAFVRMLARALIEPEPEYGEILRKQLASQLKAFLDAFEAALPGVTREEIENRVDFIIGAFGHALAEPYKRGGRRVRTKAELDAVINQLLAFAEAGLTAPAAAARTQ